MPRDEKTVIIPAGSLGVSFKGKPATISRIQDDSPLKAQFRVGMVVDRLTLPNGSSYSGLSATELVNVLKDSAILEDREVHLVIPDTAERSAKLHPSASLRPTTTPTTSTKTQRRDQRLASIPSQQQQDTVGSPNNASEKEKKLLQIRGELQGLIMKEEWSAIVGMIRGITLTDRDLAVSLIQWKNKWQANEQTLLHDVLSMPSHDPPMSLVTMLVDTCPQVLFIEDGAGHLPLHVAIYTPDTQQKSMELIRLLVQADRRRRTLSPITFWQAIRRHDEQVIRYLLTFQECSKALVIKVNGRIPLYYVSKLQDENAISPLLQLMITSTVEAMNKSTCCFYRAIELVADYVHDSNALFEICAREKLYCTNHLIDVARRRDVCVHKRQQGIKDAPSKNNKRESSQERESSTSTKPMKKVASTEDAVSTEMTVNGDANVGETNKLTVTEGTASTAETIIAEGVEEAAKETESTQAAPKDETEPDSSTEEEKVEGKEAGGAAKGSSEEGEDGATASTAPVTP